MIVPMKHVALFALKKDERRIMKALQDAEAVQVIDSGESPGANNASVFGDSESFTLACEEELAEREGDIVRIKSAIGKLSSYMEKGGLLTPAPELDRNALIDSVAPAKELCGKLEELARSAAQNKSERDKRNALIAQLKPFEAMPIELQNIKSTKRVVMAVGVINADKLSALDAAGVAYEAYGEQTNRPIIAAIPAKSALGESDRDALAALKSNGFNEIALPRLEGSAVANIERLTAERDELYSKNALISMEIEKLGAQGETLLRGYDGALIERDRARARKELFSTRETFMLTGWVRADETDKLEKAVSGVTDVYHVLYRDPSDAEKPPTALKNNKFFAPFQFITDMYSPPDSRGFDPTTVMAPFYLLFFGLMMGDTGYGIVISLLCLLMLKVKKPRGGVEKICRILVWGGVSTAICGLLTGTFFGMGWHELFGDGFAFPLIDPMIDQMTALFLYCGLGFMQIITGMVVSMTLHIKRGDWQTALFDIGSWLMIFAGAGAALLLKGGAVYIGYALIGIGLLLIVLFGGRNKKGFGRVTGGLGKLYDITGFFSDVLSYARVFALGLATGVMGSVFNMIGSMINSVFAGIPVVGAALGFIVAGALLVVLHLFCIAINALGAFIHCARLQFIEYYNRFYTPGGKNFAPLGLYTKHNKVK